MIERRKTISMDHRPVALSMGQVVSLWLPVVVWAALIYHLSGIPYLRFVPGHWDYIIRKFGHAGVFAVLARLLARAWTGTTFWSWKRIFWVSLVMTILYACTDEYHQSFTPGRVPAAHDIAIDSLGAWAALGLAP